MSRMFNNNDPVNITPIFNQDISGWDVSSVTEYTDFSTNSALEPQYIPGFA